MLQQNIYLICDEDQNYLKVGISKNIPKRLEAMQIGCPLKLKLLGKFQEGRNKEYGLHIKLRGLSITGEWYPLKGIAGDKVRSVLAEALGKVTDDFFVE
jgi:hypothetical protein